MTALDFIRRSLEPKPEGLGPEIVLLSAEGQRSRVSDSGCREAFEVFRASLGTGEERQPN